MDLYDKSGVLLITRMEAGAGDSRRREIGNEKRDR